MRRGETDIYPKVTAAVDRVVLETVLRHVKGNQVQASEVLGISRTTLRAKLRAWVWRSRSSSCPTREPRSRVGRW